MTASIASIGIIDVVETHATQRRIRVFKSTCRHRTNTWCVTAIATAGDATATTATATTTTSTATAIAVVVENGVYTAVWGAIRIDIVGNRRSRGRHSCCRAGRGIIFSFTDFHMQTATATEIMICKNI
jgi:predicted DNA repair protein MutK